MAKLLIHGSPDTTGGDSDLGASLPPGIGLRTKFSAQVRVARAGTPPHEVDVQDDDVVELDLGEGLRLWTSGAQLQQDMEPSAVRATSGEIELPNTLQIGSSSRGVGAWVIKGLKILGVDLAGTITDFVIDKVEAKLDPGPGLYHCGPSPDSPLEPMTKRGKLSADSPVLVFLHGTASSTHGSFGAFWEVSSKTYMRRLLENYAAGHVLAFQHRTLSKSPIENALELLQALAQKLPAGARLHLVSHSRGGMVGELLCRGMVEGGVPFDGMDLKRFSAPERERDRHALRALNDRLAKTPLNIERFVRVACPARGTTLADGRLDRYLSMLLNLLGATGLKANPLYDGLAALLLGVIKKRTEPRELPGLEAMMPASPLVALLNRSDVRTRADLHVLGGNVEGSGVLGRLRVLATDLYYREDHDLVVNTPAMFGGMPRTDSIRYWIDEGASVSHFNYFRNDATAERLVAALARPERAAFHALETKPAEISAVDYRKRAVGPQPVVFVLPGIMGSHLKLGEDRVWLDFRRLAAGGLARLAIDAQGVAAEKPLDDGYGALIRFLAQSHAVVPFAYDWRQPLELLADQLRMRIEEALPAAESANQPIRLLAHSMGGLVVRAMLATSVGQKTWQRLCRHPGARFIMLGTPNGGSHSIAGLLLGRDALVRKLAMLDYSHDYGELLQIVSRYPGVMALLPDSGALDLFDPAVWERLHQHDAEPVRGLFSSSAASDKSSGVQWPLPDAALLAEARSGRQALRQVRLDAERMFYVAGCAPSTPIDIVLDEAAPPGRQVIVTATEHGDGRVPWETGIPAELSDRTWYMDAVHGDMAAHEDAFPGLLDLLNLGVTTKLAQTPPVRRSRASERFVVPSEAPAMFPDEADLTAAALGGSGRAQRRKPAKKVRVRIVQGDLAHARYPVAVGHYTGDSIVSAENYLDRALGGRLREHHRLGLYPGSINTVAVFLSEAAGTEIGGEHPGAIVVGLGNVGDLTPGALMSGFAQAAVTYAAELLDCRRGRETQSTPADGTTTAPITTLLIGTGAGGLGVADSILCILRGTLQANRRLERLDAREHQGGAKPNAPRTAWINRLDIIELYEDRSIQALKALLELARAAEFRDAFEIEELLSESEGGRRRAYFEEDPAWWQRLRIESQADGSLRFEALTGRARVETNLQSNQRRLVERFLDDAAATTAADAELSYTLFEMLLPNRLKERAPDRRNVVLVLDPGAAAYPWELLHNRHDAGSRPLAVEAGMVRQLTVAQFREQTQSATNHQALVVGDPHNSDRRFPPLPGAQDEAREVAKQLRAAGYQEVSTLIGAEATPRTVLTALHTKPYRVLHLAAHGVFEFEVDDDGSAVERKPEGKRATVSGMALGEGVFLTPAEIEQLRFIPDLVFVNCCHLGQAKSEAAVQYHRLAANLATQFIRMGVRCVVAAGWAVDDAAAMTFAQAFYERFLGGRTFGESVREAREEVYLKYRSVNTWGAYQCYGDPDFSLAASATTSSSSRENRIVSAVELRVELENIAQAARSASDSGGDWLRGRLEQIVKAMPQPWLRSAATRSALGKAYAELGMFEGAISHYEAALGLDSADARLTALEQLANLRARWAVRVAESDPRKARELFKTAEVEIDRLIQIGATPERFSIKGSLNKRRAMTASRNEERKKALQQMALAYQSAYQQVSSPTSINFKGGGAYPLQNRLLAEIMLGWTRQQTSPRKAVAAGLRKLAELACTLPDEKPDFWNLCLGADVRLLQHLATQKLGPDAIGEIGRGYRSAAKRCGSPRELRSTADHIEFIERMAGSMATPSRRESLVKDLAALRLALAG